MIVYERIFLVRKINSLKQQLEKNVNEKNKPVLKKQINYYENMLKQPNIPEKDLMLNIIKKDKSLTGNKKTHNSRIVKAHNKIKKTKKQWTINLICFITNK